MLARNSHTGCKLLLVGMLATITYLHGFMTGSQQEEQQAYAEAAGMQLSAAVRLILQLVQYSFGMAPSDMALLTMHLSPQVPFW